MRWTEQETARLAYLVDKFLKEGFYKSYSEEHKNKNYTIFVNDKEVEIVVSEPTFIVAKDGDNTITIRIRE